MPTDGSEKPRVPSTDPAPDGAAPAADGITTAGTPAATEDHAEQPDQATGRIPLDLVAGLTLLAIVAVFLVNAGEDRLDWIFPRTLSYTLAIVGAYLTIRGVFGFGDKVDTLLPVLRGRGVDAFVFTALATLYVILMRPVGFWTVSALTLFVGSVYLDHERSRKRMALAALVAVAVCVLGYLLLEGVFYIPLPPERWLTS